MLTLSKQGEWEKGMREADGDWLIAVNGVMAGQPGDEWGRLGDYRFTVNQILKEEDGTLTVAAGNGLWQVPSDRSGMWIQQNDETLTEVMAIAHSPVGVIAGSPYGVAVSRVDEGGNPRWRSTTEHLRVNARFTNTILIDPRDPSRWIVGTEGGVIIGSDNGAGWEESGLNDSPVRSLMYSGNRFLAGTDSHGLMQSADAITWERVGSLTDSVYDVDVIGEQFVVGSERGVVMIEADGTHHQVGPRKRVRCVHIDRREPSLWLAGTDPGGLWTTRDSGHTWQHSGVTSRIRDIVVPEGVVV